MTLDAREAFPASTLADLYDSLAMPKRLVTAHTALDRAVDRCYRRAKFHDDRDRVEYLFALHETLGHSQVTIATPIAVHRVKSRGRRPKAKR